MQYITLGFPAWRRQAQIMGYTVETAGARIWAISREGLETGSFERGIGWMEYPPSETARWRIERGV